SSLIHAPFADRTAHPTGARIRISSPLRSTFTWTTADRHPMTACDDLVIRHYLETGRDRHAIIVGDDVHSVPGHSVVVPIGGRVGWVNPIVGRVIRKSRFHLLRTS